MAVQPQTPYIEHIANGTTADFNLGFDCDNQDHLIVLVDDIEPVVGTWSLSNGAVVFGTAPTTGKKITIQRNTPFERKRDYQSYDNSFRPPAVNKDFDWIWLKLQELGVADWILGNRLDALKGYVDKKDDQLQENIDNLKSYVDLKDDELHSYLMEEIRKQGVALDQLDDYYNYLMQRLAQIAVDKGWDASFVVDASGLNQQQINNFNLTPFHFGAIGDGSSHKLSERYVTLSEAQAVYPHATSLDDEIDWCALQALLDAAANTEDHKRNINWSGNWFLNRGIAYKTLGKGQYKSITGDFIFTLRSDFADEAVIKLHGRGITHTGLIKGDCRRLAKYAVIADQRGVAGNVNHISFGIKIGRVHTDGCLLFAVRFNGNAMFSTLEFLRTGGNGVASVYASNTVNANILSKTDFGVGGLGDYSVMKVDVLPTYDLLEARSFITCNGYVSQVVEINRTESTIRVQPHIPSPIEGDTLGYVWGGGVYITGSDSAGLVISQMSVIGSGVGLYAESQYPTTVTGLTTEFCGIALYDAGLVGGANIIESYIEGNLFDVITNSSNAGTFNGFSMLHGLPLNYKKIQNLKFGRNPDGTQNKAYGGLRGVQILEKGVIHHVDSTKFPNNYIQNNFSVDFNVPHRTQVNRVITNGLNVGFTPIEPSMNRLFCYDSQEYIFLGDGPNNTPRGTIYITPPSGYTVNGKSTVAEFSNFTETPRFIFYLRVDAKDIVVEVSGIDTSYGPSAYPAVGVTLASTLPTSWLWINTSLTDLPTPTTGTSKTGNIKTYFSNGTVGSQHNKTQEVDYLNGDKWYRVFSSSSGFYGAWVLAQSKVTKGASSARPTNPQLGMVYYDTTLLATGKPIEWNGVSWIDSSGVIV